MYERLSEILGRLLAGDISCLNTDNIIFVSEASMKLLNKESLDNYDQMCASIIISISQIVYNNTDRSVLFLDDGVYDLVLEMYKKYNQNVQVGAPEIRFDQAGEAIMGQELMEPMEYIHNPEEFVRNSLFFDDLKKSPPLDWSMFTEPATRNSGRIISKRNVNVPHMYPKLVGSLDKCKFTLNKEAMERDVFDDENVKIFERDFLAKHLQMGLIDMDTPFELVAELKYDGVSVEADVTNKILSARSRGDANNDVAADMTDVLGGYVFPHAPEIPAEEAFGMKFEAIITYQNLDKMARLRGRNYKNSRNGIIGLLGASDVYDYRDLITLIPLATSIEGIDRVQEIEFLNKYYNSGEYLRYSILRGTYTQILFQVYKFVKEAETMRAMLPFMYDGVVISYRDPKIIEALGRENSINKYSMAIKFNPLVREAVFIGWSFTVGQDGTITPMIHYTPVEFYGTIHTKSSGHSYKRFNELQLAPGDIIQVEYVNDVMPYVTKPPVSQNFVNSIPPEPFPEICPFCGTKILISESGKSAICPNKNCPDRLISKMANMMAKLNLKDFGEETFRALGTTSLSQLLNYTYDDVKQLGPMTAEKLIQRIQEVKSLPIYDYRIIGAIGFTGIAAETWRKILNVIPFQSIISDSDEDLYNKLRALKGIGEITARVIVSERHELADDLNAIGALPNIVPTFGFKDGKVIRYTGCRPNPELTEYLTSLGCDARPDAGVSKATDVLVVPYVGFTSSKTNKVRNDCVIVDMPAFQANPDQYAL